MKTLRHISGILLTTIGILSTIGAIALLVDEESRDWAFVLTFIVLGAVPLTVGFRLLRRKTSDIPPQQCPKCGGHEHAQAGVLTTNAGLMLMLIPLGAWLIACLWGGSRPQQVRCLQCDTLYFIDTRASRVTGIVLWALLLLLLLGFIAMFFNVN